MFQQCPDIQSTLRDLVSWLRPPWAQRMQGRVWGQGCCLDECQPSGPAWPLPSPFQSSTLPICSSTPLGSTDDTAASTQRPSLVLCLHRPLPGEGCEHTLTHQTQSGPTQSGVCYTNNTQAASFSFFPHVGDSLRKQHPWPQNPTLHALGSGEPEPRNQGFPRVNWTSGSGWGRLSGTGLEGCRDWDWPPAGTLEVASPAQAHGHLCPQAGTVSGRNLCPLPWSHLPPPTTRTHRTYDLKALPERKLGD